MNYFTFDIIFFLYTLNHFDGLESKELINCYKLPCNTIAEKSEERNCNEKYCSFFFIIIYYVLHHSY